MLGCYQKKLRKDDRSRKLARKEKLGRCVDVDLPGASDEVNMISGTIAAEGMISSQT